ncbi:hypothetical protein GGF32_001761 [Allomyces javanicus]|nr:hypothetical protein GGF32_001761 [Allomyces javanicus]
MADSTTRQLYTNLAATLQEIASLSQGLHVLGWDQQVLLPSSDGATAARGKALAALSGLVHEKSTAESFGALIDELEAQPDLDEELTVVERANLKLAAIDFRKNKSLPTSFVREYREHTSLSHAAWVKARKADDFPAFAPVLAKTLDFCKQYAQYVDADRPVYDVLVAEYERNLPSTRLAEIFSELREALVPMIHTINAAEHPDTAWMDAIHWDVKKQEELCKHIAQEIGFDFTRGRLDASVHPFTSGFNTYDVRITTRYSATHFAEGILGTVHEVGHAMYEQGLPHDLDGQPVGRALSLGVHESNSLFWENFVCRSRAFWRHFFPKIRELFPDIPEDKTADDLYAAINVARPGLIRVDSDEVHYPMHIVLRWELETLLLNDEVEVDDLPRIWNERMSDYVGIAPPSDKDGVLQDVHWPEGLVGYFPTYTLGQVAAAQWAHAMREQLGDLDELIEQGEFKQILHWLNENVHKKASVPESADALLEETVGEKLSPKYLIAHLKQKYSELYGIEL